MAGVRRTRQETRDNQERRPVFPHLQDPVADAPRQPRQEVFPVYGEGFVAVPPLLLYLLWRSLSMPLSASTRMG